MLKRIKLISTPKNLSAFKRNLGLGYYSNSTISFLLFIALFSVSHVSEAQKIKKKKVHTSVFNDSIQFYRKIEKMSKKRKITYEIFRNIVSLPPPSKAPIHSVHKQNEDIYAKAENKIIRHIQIITLDPFGTDIADTSFRAINYIEKAGNIMHVKTRKFAIRNHLLFKEGDTTDKIKLYESERIIRQSGYVGDVSVRIDTNYHSKDSVDIIIREQDRWSIYPSGKLGGGNYTVGLSESNFIGTGQQIEGTVSKTGLIDTNPINYRVRYFVPYIRNTFITAGLIYNQEKGNQYQGISIGRGFYSPLTRWAGGVDVYRYDLSARLTNIDSTQSQFFPIRYWSEDFWAGLAFPIKKNKTYYNRMTKLVVAASVFNKHYSNGVSVAYDPNFSLQNTTNYLVNFGISHRGYYKDKYIYKYGVTEDVPVGAMFSATMGYQVRPFDERYYMGLKSSYGLRIKPGYLSTYAEFGTYINKLGHYQQGVLNMGVNGFTNLIKLKNRFLYRQFFSIDVTSGFNRTKYDRISINEVNGLQGFNPDSLVGSNKMVISTAAIFYLPWQVIGFRFAPILYGGFGMIGDENKSFIKDNVFPVFGIGLLVRNEYLIFNSFLISLGFYPYIPNVGTGVFKFNPFGNNNFNFRNFEIGKPSEVRYY